MIPFFAFLLCIPAANWMIGNVGVQLEPGGPHLLPMGFGLYAPSGVLLVGMSLWLRDEVRERLGWIGTAHAIALGGAIAAQFAPPALLIASILAFYLAELVDTLVYEPLRSRGLGWAVLVSGMVAAVVDSVVFNHVAFGSQAHTAGQILGKVYMTALFSLPFFLTTPQETDR